MKDPEKFKELAEKRVNRAIKDLRLVGNLSNRNNYHYSIEQVQAIVGALERELKDLKLRFAAAENSENKRFTL